MSNENLKPCPFCESKDIRMDEHQSVTGSTGSIFSMCCYQCGATFPNRYSKELMIKAWNTRAKQQREIMQQPVVMVSAKRQQLNKAIELLEACSEHLFMIPGDYLIEEHIDKFLKEVKS